MINCQNYEAVFAPKLVITTCGTLQAQAVFKKNGSKSLFTLIKTSNETMMEEILNIKMNEIYNIKGDLKQEIIEDVTGNAQYGETITLAWINYISVKSDKPLLLLLYKHAINNYHNKDLVIAYAPLDLVKKQFEKLWDLLSLLTTFKSVESKMSEDMKKEYKEYATKTLELVDKFATLRLSSDQVNK